MKTKILTLAVVLLSTTSSWAAVSNSKRTDNLGQECALSKASTGLLHNTVPRTAHTSSTQSGSGSAVNENKNSSQN